MSHDEADRERLGALRAAIFLALGVASAGCDDTPAGPPPGGSAPLRSPWPLRPGIGYVTDSNGTLHRPSPMRCETPLPKRTPCVSTEKTGCRYDADCRGPYGHCDLMAPPPDASTFCVCHNACATDADCKPDEACLCATEPDGVSRCIPAKCKSDDDCGGEMCALSAWVRCGGDGLRLACRTPQDECESTTECRARYEDDVDCVYVGADRKPDDGLPPRWQCLPPLGIEGRPFRVEGVSRTARTTTGQGWFAFDVSAALEAGASVLRDGERARVATRVLEQARFEHASVASFARASLELLALGAPPDLLRDTARAMQDEIEHARLCFAIAAAYGAGDVGPGPLDLEGAMPGAVDPARVAYAVAYEGCVGETLGAAEATEEARTATDPALRAVLARIGEDETRHAALAWRTLAWLVEAFGDEARGAATRGIDDAVRDLVENGTTALRAETTRVVVEPCAARVLG